MNYMPKTLTFEVYLHLFWNTLVVLFKYIEIKTANINFKIINLTEKKMFY